MIKNTINNKHDPPLTRFDSFFYPTLTACCRSIASYYYLFTKHYKEATKHYKEVTKPAQLQINSFYWFSIVLSYSKNKLFPILRTFNHTSTLSHQSVGTSLPDGRSTDNVIIIIIIIIRNGLIPSPIGSNPHNNSRSLNQTCTATDQLA